MSALTDYAFLCESHDAIHHARNLPERFHAVLHYHGDLARFVEAHPRALKLGVEALAREEITTLRLVA